MPLFKRFAIFLRNYIFLLTSRMWRHPDKTTVFFIRKCLLFANFAGISSENVYSIVNLFVRLSVNFLHSWIFLQTLRIEHCSNKGADPYPRQITAYSLNTNLNGRLNWNSCSPEPLCPSPPNMHRTMDESNSELVKREPHPQTNYIIYNIYNSKILILLNLYM